MFILALCLLLSTPAARAGESDWKTFTYDFEVGEERLGHLKVKVTEDLDGADTIAVVHTEVKLKKKVLFITIFSMEVREEARIDSGGIRDFTSTTKIGGTEIHVRGRETSNEAVFQTVVKDSTLNTRIPRSVYQFTSLGEPEGMLDSLGHAIEVQVLDLDRLTVGTHCFRCIDRDTLSFDSRDWPCRVVQFEAGFESGRRWIAEDGDPRDRD